MQSDPRILLTARPVCDNGTLGTNLALSELSGFSSSRMCK